MARPSLKQVNTIVCALRAAAEQYTRDRSTIAAERNRLTLAGEKARADVLKRTEDQFYRQWQEALNLADEIECGGITLN